jgi:hypothetical protein
MVCLRMQAVDCCFLNWGAARYGLQVWQSPNSLSIRQRPGIPVGDAPVLLVSEAMASSFFMISDGRSFFTGHVANTTAGVVATTRIAKRLSVSGAF